MGILLHLGLLQLRLLLDGLLLGGLLQIGLLLCGLLPDEHNNKGQRPMGVHGSKISQTKKGEALHPVWAPAPAQVPVTAPAPA